MIMFLWKNIRVAINFAGMLLVACEKYMLVMETLKRYYSALVISKWNTQDVGTDGQTDMISESSYGNMSAHKIFSSKLKIKS